MLFTHASDGIGDVLGSDTGIVVSSVGADPASAMLNAAAMADRITSDPIVRALMPPQVQAAIMATKLSAAATKKGLKAVKGLWGRLRGKKKKKMLRTMATAQAKANRDNRGRAPSPPARELPADNTADDEEPAHENQQALSAESQAYGDIMNPDEPEWVDPRDQNDVDVDFSESDDEPDDDDGMVDADEDTDQSGGVSQ